jgi:hypothetical protein
MSGLLTYREENQQTSALVGYAIRQAGAQGYLTNAQVVAATTVQDLIDDVNSAIVSPGAEADSQRNSIARALKEGGSLGDLSDARIQPCTTVTELANLTWVSGDADASHLGTNLVP